MKNNVSLADVARDIHRCNGESSGFSNPVD